VTLLLLASACAAPTMGGLEVRRQLGMFIGRGHLA
jgi:hypothetical protein